MPELLPFARTFIAGVLSYLTGRQQADDVAALWRFVGSEAGWLNRFVNAMYVLMRQQHGAWQFVQPKAKDAGGGFTDIVSEDGKMWHHLLDTILPRSLGYLEGHVFSHGITPLRQRLGKLEKQDNRTQARVTALESWEKNTAMPLLNGWRQFIAWWDKNFSNPAAALIDWFAHPAHFGTWAAPPITGPLVAYLADPAHADSRDNLSQIMVRAWSERPNDTMTAIAQWLVTEPH